MLLDIISGYSHVLIGVASLKIMLVFLLAVHHFHSTFSFDMYSHTLYAVLRLSLG